MAGNNKDAVREGMEGVAESAKGAVKKGFGKATGQEDMEQEGQAQKDSGGSHRKAASHEAEAEKERAAAEAAKLREHAHHGR